MNPLLFSKKRRKGGVIWSEFPWCMWIRDVTGRKILVPSRPDVPKIYPVGTSRVFNKSLRNQFSEFQILVPSRRPDDFVPSRDIPTAD